MTMYAVFPIRLWRTGFWNPNPMMRTSDRFQSVVNVLAIAVVLAAVPIAATIGSETYVSARLASPGSGSTPAWLGIGTAVIVGAAVAAVCALAIAWTRFVVGRRHLRQWDLEWVDVANAQKGGK